MLITQLKEKSALDSLTAGKVFLITCQGCRELYFPEEEIRQLHQELEMAGKVTGSMEAVYICNEKNLALEDYSAAMAEADRILVFSCGLGVQTVAQLLPSRQVCAGCDTYPLPGRQGLTPLEHDCSRCGACYLNLTGGICPITACTKGLVNGQCGGAKNGMCEADPGMECGWERILRRLAQVGRLDALKCPVQIRSYDK